jgi:hypothetical protein
MFGNSDFADYSPWVIVPTIFTALILLIRQARIDRQNSNNKAVEQWETIALAEQAQRLIVCGQLEEAREEINKLQVKVARMEEIGRNRDDVIRLLREKVASNSETST